MIATIEKETILIVEDTELTLEVVKRILVNSGYVVFTAGNVEEALRLLDRQPVDLILTDIKMPQISGLDLIKHVRENFPDSEVIVMTGYATVEGAVEAVKAGAEEYVTKPFTDKELLCAVQSALKKLQSRRLSRIKDKQIRDFSRFGLIGQSESMQPVYSAIAKAANTSATVLVSGESGTGKELIARAIHYSSRRSSAPFIAVNCAGIPETLLESELFGHVKGAFTGAYETRAGFFITADGGTLFFDEIGEMSFPIQAKLLRALQEREVTMVGTSRPRSIDVRIIAATNKDLSQCVRRGTFREDLFFRLNVIPINIPPLRERGDDILLLAKHLGDKFSLANDRKPLKFSDSVIRLFLNYDWPGNVRELENLLQRLAIMADSEVISPGDLPPSMRFSISRNEGLNRTLDEVIGEHVRAVLNNVNGNKSRAAKILGIDRSTLRSKLNDGEGVEE